MPVLSFYLADAFVLDRLRCAARGRSCLYAADHWVRRSAVGSKPGEPDRYSTAETEGGVASVGWHNRQHSDAGISLQHTLCCRGDTCESAGCTTDCSHRGRRSNSAALLQSPCSPPAGSTRSASSGPATETQPGYQQEDLSTTTLTTVFSVSPESPLALCTSSWEPWCTQCSHWDPSPGPTTTGQPVPGRQTGPRTGKNGTENGCSPVCWNSRCERGVEREDRMRKPTLENGKLQNDACRRRKPEHGADRAQWSEAARRHLAQLDVAHRVSSGTVDHVRRGDKLGPADLHRLQLSPAPQQLRFHQLGIDGRPVGNCLTALLRGRGETRSQCLTKRV